MEPPRELPREEVAKIEVGRTAVGPAVARLLVLAFLVSLAGVPLAQWVYEARVADGGATAWAHLAEWPAAARATFVAERDDGAGRFAAVVTADREALRLLDAFEDALEDDALLGRRLRPLTQSVLSGWLGVGNEQAYVGRDGWLFYRPEVEYLTGRGFLESHQPAARASAARPQRDPRPALLHFKRQLDARGISLVLMPTPVKPMIHPEKLTPRRAPHETPLQNPSFERFVRDLERDGVLVFDVAGAMAAVTTTTPAYLATDTHWRPEVVEAVAGRLASFLVERAGLPPSGGIRYRVERADVTNLGDIALMLDLPPGQSLYPRERVRIRRVLDPEGVPWRASRSADVLLLGDSFSNIYSLRSLGWGDAAGLAEQLSFALERPVDRIVQNDNGAYATRELLARDMSGSRDRLVGKRVVIHQFAARELALGDWRIVDLPPPAR